MTAGRRVELGFGASGAWALPTLSERRAIDVVLAAAGAGVRHFDTAGFYNKGKAEPRLGRALAEARRRGVFGNDPITVSTKIGKAVDRQGRLIRDFSIEAIDLALGQARERLSVETLDIVYMHGPNEHELLTSLPHLLVLKDQGILNAIGVCTEGIHLATAAKIAGVDAVMAPYNFIHAHHADSFRIAKSAGKRVIATAPLAQGLWRRNMSLPTSPADIWYLARALAKNRAEWRTARKASWIHEYDDITPTEIALGFVAANPDIDMTLTTSTRPHHIQESAAALSRRLPDNVKRRLGLDVGEE